MLLSQESRESIVCTFTKLENATIASSRIMPSRTRSNAESSFTEPIIALLQTTFYITFVVPMLTWKMEMKCGTHWPIMSPSAHFRLVTPFTTDARYQGLRIGSPTRQTTNLDSSHVLEPTISSEIEPRIISMECF